MNVPVLISNENNCEKIGNAGSDLSKTETVNVVQETKVSEKPLTSVKPDSHFSPKPSNINQIKKVKKISLNDFLQIPLF